MVYTHIYKGCFYYLLTNNLLVGCQQVGRKKRGKLSLTTMVSQGTETQQKIVYLTTYHSSFMVHWWVLVHVGPFPGHSLWVHSMNPLKYPNAIPRKSDSHFFQVLEGPIHTLQMVTFKKDIFLIIFKKRKEIEKLLMHCDFYNLHTKRYLIGAQIFLKKLSIFFFFKFWGEKKHPYPFFILF